MSKPAKTNSPTAREARALTLAAQGFGARKSSPGGHREMCDAVATSPSASRTTAMKVEDPGTRDYFCGCLMAGFGEATCFVPSDKMRRLIKSYEKT